MPELKTKEKILIETGLGILLLTIIAFVSGLGFYALAENIDQDSQINVASMFYMATADYSVTLNWTSPGDDGSSGTAARYDIRYSTSTISESNWALATAVTGEPTPHITGTAESMIVSGLQPDTQYFFGLKTRDERSNWSALSNIATVTTPASPIPSCTEDWTCSDWTACENETQTRTCTDQNACGTSENKPVLSQTCQAIGGPAIDTVSPNTTILTNTNLITSTKFTFSWEGLDDITIVDNLNFSYKYDDQSWSSWSSDKSLSIRHLRNGHHTFQVQTRDEAGNIDPSPAVQEFTVRLNTFIAAGVESGGGPMIRLFTPEGRFAGQFFSFEQSFRGGISLAVGDLGDDGHDEIIVGSGPGRRNEVRIFRTDGSLITSFMPFSANYSEGLNVSLADVDGDGKDEIITTPKTGITEVKVFGFSGGSFIEVYPKFLAYPDNFKGGASIVGADVDGDGKDEILTLPYSGGGPNSRIFGLRNSIIKPVGLSIMAFAPSLRASFALAAGDLNNNGKQEIIVAVRNATGPHIRVLGINRQKMLDVLSPGFFAYGKNSRPGLRISTVDSDYDGKDEILVSKGEATSPVISIFFYNGFTAVSKGTIETFPKPLKPIIIHDSGTY
ncbi:MAG: FG-GAP-like repeat-containing protein [Patescibacteria group bacterium]|jgi:hypothetical protein